MLTLQFKSGDQFVENDKTKANKPFGKVTCDMNAYETTVSPNLHTLTSISVTYSITVCSVVAARAVAR